MSEKKYTAEDMISFAIDMANEGMAAGFSGSKSIEGESIEDFVTETFKKEYEDEE
jgi:hypothetical protein